MEHNVGLLSQLKDLSTLPAPLRREVEAVIHKMTYPMANILAQVPGDSLTERAKRLKVSRQTMYVWLSEKFRPTRVQAKRIARITGVPIEQIVDDGFEVKHDARGKARKKAATMAAGRRKAAKGASGNKPRRRGKVDAQSRASTA